MDSDCSYGTDGSASPWSRRNWGSSDDTMVSGDASTSCLNSTPAHPALVAELEKRDRRRTSRVNTRGPRHDTLTDPFVPGDEAEATQLIRKRPV